MMRCNVINRRARTLPACNSSDVADNVTGWGKIMAAGMLIALPPLSFTFVAATRALAGLKADAAKG